MVRVPCARFGVLPPIDDPSFSQVTGEYESREKSVRLSDAKDRAALSFRPAKTISGLAQVSQEVVINGLRRIEGGLMFLVDATGLNGSDEPPEFERV